MYRLLLLYTKSNVDTAHIIVFLRHFWSLISPLHRNPSMLSYPSERKNKINVQITFQTLQFFFHPAKPNSLLPSASSWIPLLSWYPTMQYYPSCLLFMGNSFDLLHLVLSLPMLSKYWVSTDPPPSWHSWVIPFPSNLALCPNDSQIFISMKTAPLIYRLLQYSSPFLNGSQGPPAKSLPKWLPHLNMSALPAFPILSWHYFGTKTCIYPQFLLFLLHHHIPLKGWTTPAHQILSQLPSPSLKLDCLQQLPKWPSYVLLLYLPIYSLHSSQSESLKQRSNVSLLHLQPSFL